jgi:lipopolysaccharide transport system permease protein
LVEYRQLLAALAWKNVALRYKQAPLSIAWAVLDPFVLMLTLVFAPGFIVVSSGATLNCDR